MLDLYIPLKSEGAINYPNKHFTCKKDCLWHYLKSNTMWHIYITLILCVISVRISALDILRVTNISDYNKLSQNTVRCMIQDSRGFIWMGTVNGINRYNGKEFILIEPQEGSSVQLSDTRIRQILEDKNSHIWIRTFSNTVYCYDLNSESFVDYAPLNDLNTFSNIQVVANGDVWFWGSKGCCRVQHSDNGMQIWSPDNMDTQDNTVSFIFEDSDRNIWLGTNNELYRIIGNTSILISKGSNFLKVHESDKYLFFLTDKQIMIFDKQKHSFFPEVKPVKNIISLNRSCMLNNGVILIATKEDILMFDTKEMKFDSANKLFQGQKISNANFVTDNKGHIWVYNMSGVLWQNMHDNTFEPLNLIPSDILSLISLERYQIYHDSRNIIWITTFGNGLYAIDRNDGEIHHYSTDNDLVTNYLLCIMEDSSGEIWLGTELAGAIKISLTNYPFEIFYPSLNKNSDRDNAVRLIYEDSAGYFWFGTRDGNVHVYDSLFQKSYIHKIPGGLPFSIAEDSLGCKWLGTKGGGLLLFPPKGRGLPQTYLLHDNEEQSSSSNNIFTIMSDSKKRMWMASFGGGVHLAERERGRLSFRQINMKDRDHDMMRSMIQDDYGLIWIGCNDGVVVFDPDEIIYDESRYINLHLDAKNRHSLNNKEVRVVFQDSHKRIWLGTSGGGLNLLMREDTLCNSWFKHYDAKNGLSNEMVQAIREDNDGYIWISTESGISKFNPKTEQFENFMFDNKGLAAVFNELSSWKKKDGELMFGSYKGVYIFNPEKISYNSFAPPVLITDLYVNGTKIKPDKQGTLLTESITTAKKIMLKHDQNSFNLACFMLNFHAPELNQYMYYLEGYENDWNNLSRNNTASYRNVPQGTYFFKVKGCNSFGIWSDNETVLEIIIYPPWWKSTWAILSYIVLLSALIFFAFRLIIKMQKLNMAVEVEKQLTEHKLRFFTNISHEFRTPLTIIRGSIENLNNLENMPLPAKKQISILSKGSSRLLRLIDQLLEFRRLQNDKMKLNLELTDTVNFIYDIYLTFKELAEKKKIDFVFESNEDEVKILLDKNKLDKITCNLLSNAFKHTPINGKIILRLNFSFDKDCFTLSVSDNGVGVPKSQRDKLFIRFNQMSNTAGGTGIGLHLTSELTKIHLGNILYSESEFGGACFSVILPISEKKYDKNSVIHSHITGKSNVMYSVSEQIKDVENIEPVELHANKSFKDYKILVIEDEDDVREFIKDHLNNYFTVDMAENATEGLEKIASNEPDIIICDVMMPGVDGFELTKQLKNNFDTGHIPLILLTAHSSEEHRLQGIEAGADSYIVKPFSIRYLMMRVIKLIEQREKLRNKFATEPGITRPSISSTERDKIFYDKLHDIINQNINNVNFTVNDFAQALGFSRTVFFKKVKGLTGYSPNEYLRIVRMKKAAELLMSTGLTVAEISYKIGIEDPFYFSRCFKTQFGKSPAQYRKKL